MNVDDLAGGIDVAEKAALLVSLGQRVYVDVPRSSLSCSHGFRQDDALTLGKAVAGLNAQAKGRRRGIYPPREESPKKAREKRARGEGFLVEICGRTVPATRTDDGIRATTKGKPIDPASVDRYLKSKFGDDIDRVRAAMETLIKAFTPESLADETYPLYERFRPDIPAGKQGWGAAGALDLALIERLAKE